MRSISQMPVAVPPDSLVPPEKVQIDIDDQSVVHWQGLPVTAQELEEQMALVAQQPVPPEIHLRPSRTAATRSSPTCCPRPSARA